MSPATHLTAVAAIQNVQHILGASSKLQLLLFGVVAAIVAVPAITWLVTTARFHASEKTKSQPHPPPVIPYAIPFIGHLFSFLNPAPAAFHDMMQGYFTAYPDIGCFSVVLGGQRTHILASADLVQRLFKARDISRERFTRELMVRGAGLSAAEDFQAYDARARPAGRPSHAHMNEDVNRRHLLRQPAVNTLTSKFMAVFQAQLAKSLDGGGGGDAEDGAEVPLYLFVRDNMFVASTTALYGPDIFRHIPNLAALFWAFSDSLLTRFLQLGKLAPAADRALDALLDPWEQWKVHLRTTTTSSGDDDDDEWNPVTGSALVRARQAMYDELGLSDRGCASFDLGFMFALNSNAVPAACWLVSHLVRPANAGLLARVRAEVERARLPGAGGDGDFDMAALLSPSESPYLNSCVHETLRCYVDVMITRIVLADDFVLDDDAAAPSQHRYAMRRGDMLIAPPYLGHHRPSFWASSEEEEEASSEDQSVNAWHGERFLRHDAATGQAVCSTAGTAGKFFPFGGGTYLCPGRMFAKQEILGAAAALLARFDVAFVEYVDVDDATGAVTRRRGADERRFPAPKSQFTGGGTLWADGDVLVRVRARP